MTLGMEIAAQWENGSDGTPIRRDLLARKIDDAIAAEREVIAKMIETWEHCRYVEHVQELCECRPMAAAIRARSKEEVL
jgi:hypothetical protein